MKNIYLVFFFLCMGAVSFAQTGSVTGKIMDDNEAVTGAVVRLDGTSFGAITDLQGMFTINNIPSGDYTVVVRSIGFDDYTTTVNVGEGSTSIGTVTMQGGSNNLQGIEIIADVAIDRKTPVAVTNISGEYIAERTGNQELTMALATAPSVYASQQGGGFGDSRLTVRGFGDENVVVMVNGVPVNDMENQSLFWSNWVGLQDVASKVQIQRGLGASMLAVPSVGGTVNIISKATDQKKGGWASAGIGNDGYRKYAAQLSTGDMNGWGITVNGSRTVQDGYVDATFADAYSWFAAVSKDFKNHSFTLTGFGAPQRHGQRFNTSLNTFVQDQGGDYESFIKRSKAKDFDQRGATLNGGSANSIRYNPQSWGYTDYDVNGGFNYRGLFNRNSNFYHKPQTNLSHYWQANDRLEVVSNVYGSWGRGGGASRTNRGISEGGYRVNGGPVNWDGLIADNIAANPTGIASDASGNDYYFFRASMNHHNYYGALSKAIYEVNENITFTGGIDARTYKAEHFRKIIDLMGLSGFAHNDFTYTNPGFIAREDQKVFGTSGSESYFNRDNTGKVRWLGAFSEIELEKDKLTAALGMSASNKSYQKIQRVTSGGVEGESDVHNFLGGAIKAGGSYDVSDAFFVYGNAGYLSIQPIFDNVFLRGNNGGVFDGLGLNEDAENEKVLAFEAGAGLRMAKMAANLNVYRTSWQDKAIAVSQQSLVDPTVFNTGNATGVDALHQGVELDLRFQPIEKLDINGSVSVGDWQWKNNSPVQLFDELSGNLIVDETIYLEDVKVGNAPQTQIALGANYKTPFGLGLYADYQHNMDMYADFNLDTDNGDVSDIDRLNPDLAGVNSNALPDFGLTNFGVNYEFDVTSNNKLRLDFNVNNLFDVLYVNQAVEGITTTGGVASYDNLSTLRGNFGLGRTWNSSARLFFNEPKPKVVKEIVEVPVATKPVILDRDKDGVIDAADKCPDTPGTLEGCPDTDGDGVADDSDDCPEEAGLASNNGCPAEAVEVEIEIPDADGDGILDNVDKCPEVAGSVYNAGCPEEAKVVTPSLPDTNVVNEINFIAKSILFNTNSESIKEESKIKLNEIASIMKRFPNTDFVIEGHTDSVGDANYNKSLSEKRAQAVKTYLVNQGVSSNLSARGYGEEQPVADNSTVEGRKQNRRVVIRLGN